MPGITLHFHLARTGVDHWRASRSTLPFDPDDPVSLNAFMHGAIGPDLGYLPGGVRVLSDLAHRERTGQLAGNLVRSARTPVERAFAWGWLTHVLADRLVHPWIGRGVGELLGRSREFVPGAADPLSHLRVEIGVDLWFAARHPAARRIRLEPVFDALSVRFLQNAYEETYGDAFPDAWFLDSHVSAGRRARQSLATLPVLGVLMEDSVWRFSLPVARRLLARAYRFDALRGISLAYLNPVAPTDWLMAGIGDAIAEYRTAFLAALDDGAESVGDFHLDTGRPLEPEVSGLPEAQLAGAA